MVRSKNLHSATKIDDITIRMLLNHTAGFQAPSGPYGDGEPWEPFPLDLKHSYFRGTPKYLRGRCTATLRRRFAGR